MYEQTFLEHSSFVTCGLTHIFTSTHGMTEVCVSDICVWVCWEGQNQISFSGYTWFE